MNIVRLVFATVCFICGSITILISIVGVFRFKFVLNRMHCAAIIDSIGFLLIIVGIFYLSIELHQYLNIY